MSTQVRIKLRMGTETLCNSQVYIELEDSVHVLKQKISKLDKDLSIDNFEVVYCGNVMEDSETIGGYGVMNGVTVHVFKKMKHEMPITPKTLSEVELLKLGVAFRSLSLNSSYRNALLKLNKPEVISNIIMTTPGLSRDPVAITLLQHSELLVKLGDLEIVKKIAENHPALAEAAQHIAAAVHEEALQNNHTPASLIGNSSSLLNNISDDDMDDLNDSSPESRSHPISRNSSFGTITAAQLASAIANATSQQQNQPQSSSNIASTSTGITRDMLQSAIGDLQNQPVVGNTQNVLAENASLQSQLQKMRDMGLTNDAINIEALRVSNGSLGAAIELVLSGFMSDD